MKNESKFTKIEVHKALMPEQVRACLEVRRKVFIDEQGVPESIELDEYESSSSHFLALVDGMPVGTGRLRLKKSYVKFERIASLSSAHGLGIGRAVMEFMQSYAARHHSEYLPAMHAQQSAIGFYERLGWVAVGDPFSEADIEHRVMIFPPAQRETRQKLKAWTDPETRADVLEYLRRLD